jgi:RNA polymerase sigma-70 factor (ECF subfamily)
MSATFLPRSSTNIPVSTATSPAREHDLALARRAAAGDRVAQRDLFQSHRAGVHHTLFRILGNNRELEDLIQDAFLEIFRSLDSFRGDSTLSRWCQTIATRSAYLYMSRRKPPSVDLAVVEEIVANDDDTRRHAMVREAARRLYIALALSAIDGLSLKEVAELTESTVFSVKTRVWRARKQLFARAAKDPVLAPYLDELAGGKS